MLKIGNDHFEATHLEPKVDVCDRRYVFDAQAGPNSPNPLVFNSTGKCPAFVVNPKIARRISDPRRICETAAMDSMPKPARIRPILLCSIPPVNAPPLS